MRGSFFFSILLLAGSYALAQAAPQASRMVLKAGPQSVDCPVELSAQWNGGSGQMLKTRKEHPTGAAQNLLIIVRNPNAYTIARAHVIIHGVPLQRRVLPAGPGNAYPDDVVKQFDIKRRIESGASATSDIWIEQVSGIRYVELWSFVYSDGPSWHSSKRSNCRVAPDRMMLISSR